MLPPPPPKKKRTVCTLVIMMKMMDGPLYQTFRVSTPPPRLLADYCAIRPSPPSGCSKLTADHIIQFALWLHLTVRMLVGKGLEVISIWFESEQIVTVLFPVDMCRRHMCIWWSHFDGEVNCIDPKCLYFPRAINMIIQYEDCLHCLCMWRDLSLSGGFTPSRHLRPSSGRVHTRITRLTGTGRAGVGRLVWDGLVRDGVRWAGTG